VLSQLFYAGLRTMGITALARRLRDGGVVLGYHNVIPSEDGADALGLHLPFHRFAAQVHWLAGHYDVVPLSELVRRVGVGGSSAHLAALTFDDGYRGVFDFAWPLLRDLGLPATVFVVAEAPRRTPFFWWDCPAIAPFADSQRGRWLTEFRGDQESILLALGGEAWPAVPEARRAASWPAIRDAARSGLDIGAHSARHRVLPLLSDAELLYETRACREIIEREAGVTPRFFAYPYGLTDRRSREAVREAGYAGGVTQEGGLISRGSDPFRLPRVNVPATISPPAFQAWAAGLGALGVAAA